jgi:hypothetical protein
MRASRASVAASGALVAGTVIAVAVRGLLAARDGRDRHRDAWLAAVKGGRAPWEQ